MKTLLSSFAALAILLTPGALRAQDAPPPPPDAQGAPPPGDPNAGPDGQDVASYQTFYDQLGGQDGSWIQSDQYGYVFQPNVSDSNWAPYTNGNWVYSDDGWTWNSDEPWGWATYHYGRWANVDGIGWVWVPGSRWAPAWVSWRYGGGYAGWAPLPPETLDDGDGEADFHFGDDVDVSFDIGAGWYNFIPYGDFGAPDCGRYIVDRNRNFVIINNTRNVTNFNVGRRGRGFGGVFAGGPSLAEVNAHSHNRIQSVRLNESAQPGRGNLHGNSFSVYAPHFNRATANQSRPANVSRHVAQTQFNRGTSISQPMQVTANVHGRAASASQITQARHAEASAPTAARVHAGNRNAGAGGSGNFHPQAAATGEPSATGEPVHHNNAAVGNSFRPDAAETGEAAHTGEPARTENQPTEHHETAPAEHHEAAPAEHHEAAPAEHHEAAPAEHHEAAPAEHHEAAPAEHHEAAPQHTEEHHAEAPHPQAQAQHAEAPHPQGGGNKPSGGGKPPGGGKDDNKK